MLSAITFCSVNKAVQEIEKEKKTSQLSVSFVFIGSINDRRSLDKFQAKQDDFVQKKRESAHEMF